MRAPASDAETEANRDNSSHIESDVGRCQRPVDRSQK